MSRKAASPRGLALSTLGVLVMGAFVASVFMRSSHDAAMEPQTVVTIVTLGTLVTFLSGVFFPTGEKVIAFSPAEVDFLFPGPFTRTQLLLFLMVRNLGGQLVGALFLSLILFRHSEVWITGYLAIFLALMFSNLFSMLVRLTASAITFPKALVRRYGVRLLLLAAIAGYVGYRGAPGFLPEQISWSDVQTVVHRGLAPLTVFGRIATADSIGAFGGWVASGVTLNALLVLAVLRLDRTTTEALLTASQRTHQRHKARGSRSAERNSVSTAFHLPWLWGCGPNAWRQVIVLQCRATRIATTTLFAAALLGGAYMASSRMNVSETDAPMFIFLAPVFFFVMFNIVQTVTFDFRSDLEQLAWLKTLPLRPLQMAVGQLAVPVAAATAINAVFLLPIAWMAHSFVPLLLLPWLATINLVLIAVENTSFLLFPYASAGGAGDTHAIGRRIVVMFVNSMILAVLGLVAGGVGLGITHASKSLWPPLCGAWLTFTTLALVLLWPVAYAFRSYDPGIDSAE